MKLKILLAIIALLPCLTSFAQVNLRQKGSYQFTDHSGVIYTLTICPKVEVNNENYYSGKTCLKNESSGEMFYGSCSFDFKNDRKRVSFTELLPIDWKFSYDRLKIGAFDTAFWDNGYPQDILYISEQGWLYPNGNEYDCESPKRRLKLTKVATQSY